MPAPEPHRSPEKLARLGAEAFDHQVRPALPPEDDSMFVAIDMGSGDYEPDEDDLAAVIRLRSRRRLRVWRPGGPRPLFPARCD